MHPFAPDDPGMNTPANPEPTRLRLRIVFGEDAMLGPGKAELLEHIRATGCIGSRSGNEDELQAGLDAG